ncbi:AbrB/MazE/SpoVT family DNA-binding domain-containing protein [Herbihabitans rhizosphaerae]|uniref:AbrB/MazE/SpoVT family DNA-binding domain-containing protein n=1 Tax=Herbihabitans rhizosphaerae TaxID=1872711 RepID=UPI00102B647F|nr:AbrB/MazE/SpoVT family DNA-binding domain-containing protein [Herbihabitans rhizosphaerae]
MGVSALSVSQVQVTATADGRVTIPATLRKAAGIEAGQRLVVYVEDGRVVLEQWEHLLDRVQSRVVAATGAHTGLASEELIAERRAEAKREDASANATTDGPPA